MLGLLKYIRGYLKIRVSGFSPERFMNLCGNKDILLWDITQENDNYVMCISLKSFYKLRPIVRKTGTRVAILQRYGLPFFVPTLYKRKVFLAGLFLAVGFWYVSTLFVWDIDLSGNYQITDDVLTEFLEERGIKSGVPKKKLLIGELEREIRKQFPTVTWTSAKLDGTRLTISIKENDAPIINDIADADKSRFLYENTAGAETAGTDLVSEYAGRIVSVIVRSGVPRVHAGDMVEKGAVLVDGKVPVYNDDATLREYIFTDADADIVIEHQVIRQETLPRDYVVKEYTGQEKKQYFLQLGDETELKLPCEEPYLVYDTVMRLSRPVLFEKLDIPVFAGCYVYREYQNVEHTYTPEEAEALLKEKLGRFLVTLEEKGVQIIENDVRIDTNENVRVMQGVFVVQEAAGRRTATDRGEQTVHE